MTQSGCLQLTSHVLVSCASQHGVHRVSHLVEEVFHHAGREQGGGALGGLGQAQHQHHNRKLVLTHVLAPAAPTDGEVAVLRGREGVEMQNRVRTSAQSRTKSPDDGFVCSHLMRFIGPMEKVAVDVPQQAFSLMDHSLKQTT